MENIRKHLEDSFNQADEAYWNLQSRLEPKKKELQQLQNEVAWMENDVKRFDAERIYFTNLLNELNISQ